MKEIKDFFLCLYRTHLNTRENSRQLCKPENSPNSPSSYVNTEKVLYGLNVVTAVPYVIAEVRVQLLY